MPLDHNILSPIRSCIQEPLTDTKFPPAAEPSRNPQEMFFRRFTSPQNCNALLGDLKERHAFICKKKGKRQADLWLYPLHHSVEQCLVTHVAFPGLLDIPTSSPGELCTYEFNEALKIGQRFRLLLGIAESLELRFEG